MTVHRKSSANIRFLDKESFFVYNEWNVETVFL